MTTARSNMVPGLRISSLPLYSTTRPRARLFLVTGPAHPTNFILDIWTIRGVRHDLPDQRDATVGAEALTAALRVGLGLVANRRDADRPRAGEADGGDSDGRESDD